MCERVKPLRSFIYNLKEFKNRTGGRRGRSEPEARSSYLCFFVWHCILWIDFFFWGKSKEREREREREALIQYFFIKTQINLSTCKCTGCRFTNLQCFWTGKKKWACKCEVEGYVVKSYLSFIRSDSISCVPSFSLGSLPKIISDVTWYNFTVTNVTFILRRFWIDGGDEEHKASESPGRDRNM